MGSSPAITLALFHTLFNVLGVLLIWPISNRVVKFLSRRFQTREELESQPRYLDKNVLALPHIALQALTKEVSRIREMTLTELRQALSDQPPPRREPLYGVAQKLSNAVGSYCAELSRTTLPTDIARMLPNLIRATQQFTAVLQSLLELADAKAASASVQDDAVNTALHDFRQAAGSVLDQLDATLPDTPPGAAEPVFEVLESEYAALKEQALIAAAVGRLNVASMDGVLHYSSLLRRILKQTRKASRRLTTVQDELSLDAKGNVPQPEADEASTDSNVDTAA
jgi:phosphate:Na+ symporter